MRKLTFKIRRPNGEIEIVDATQKFGAMNPDLFAKIQKMNREGGRGEVLSWEETFTDSRSEAEKAYDAVHRAEVAVEAAEADGTSPARIVSARAELDRVRADWEANFPESAAAKAAEAAAEKEEELRVIRSGEEYQAKLAGRD